MTKAEALMVEKTTEEWEKTFRKAEIPATPVYFTEELPGHVQVVANENMVELEHPLLGRLTMYGPTLKMSETPPKAQRAAPVLREHTQEILTGLGYSEEDIGRLCREGVTR